MYGTYHTYSMYLYKFLRDLRMSQIHFANLFLCMSMTNFAVFLIISLDHNIMSDISKFNVWKLCILPAILGGCRHQKGFKNMVRGRNHLRVKTYLRHSRLLNVAGYLLHVRFSPTNENQIVLPVKFSRMKF